MQAIDEFFDTGRYLVFGCLFASLVQVYVPTRILTSISATPVIAILLLMVLSFLLSLCSEADAFVGSSLLTSFGVAPVLAFLVIGPMLDVKNLLMMKNYLKTRFIWQFIGIVSGVVLLYAWFVGGSAMIRFLILAGYFELTMYLQLSGKLNQYINLHYLTWLIFPVLVLCFSSCAADHLGQADEDPQSSLWLLGKSGEYFLALYSFCLSGYFSLQ